MKTIHIVFVGGPECGAVRVLPYPEPVIRIPIALPTVFVAGDDTSPVAPEPLFHYYMPTGQRDSYKRAIYEYRGER